MAVVHGMAQRLKTTAAYPYAGRSLAAGDEFDASDGDATLLKLVGRAVDAPAVVASAAVLTRDLHVTEDEPAPMGPPRAKRRYRRRDLQAEP